jgi:hypothetical protein
VWYDSAIRTRRDIEVRARIVNEIRWEYSDQTWCYDGYSIKLEGGEYRLYGHSHYGTQLDRNCRYAMIVAQEEYIKE